MIKINNLDFDLTVDTIAPNPLFGYVDEYKEYPVISGKIHRDYAGKRFKAEIPCGYFTDKQIHDVYMLQNNQKDGEELIAQIDMPGGEIFSGRVYLSINDLQKRFAKIGTAYVWTNWNVVLLGADLV